MNRRDFLKGTGAAVALLATGIEVKAGSTSPIEINEKPAEPPCGLSLHEMMREILSDPVRQERMKQVISVQNQYLEHVLSKKP